MKQEFGKYYLRYAWFPKKLDNGERIWFDNYYEVHFNLPMVDPVYTISRISSIDYIVESLKGNIQDGRATDWGFKSVSERMLNTATLAPFKKRVRKHEELQ